MSTPIRQLALLLLNSTMVRDDGMGEVEYIERPDLEEPEQGDCLLTLHIKGGEKVIFHGNHEGGLFYITTVPRRKKRQKKASE